MMHEPIHGEEQLREQLGASALWRALSLALRPPPVHLGDELRELAAPLPAPLRERLQALAMLAVRAGDDLQCDHHRLLGAAGACPPGESDHLLAGLIAAKGGILGDVGAFYRAFGFDAARELAEAPDHVAIELAFLSWLHLKEAFALVDDAPGDAEICRAAREGFLRDHLDAWLPRFCDRLEQAAADGFYAEAARLLRELRLGTGSG